MKVEFLNPFVYAGLRVLAGEVGLGRSIPGKPRLVWADSTLHAVNVVVGVVGSVQGLAIYGMELEIAKGIIQAMVGEALSISDPMAVSALGELANVITGLASGSLSDAGYPCRISPPAIVQGTGRLIMQHSVPMVMVPISTELGDIKLYLALNEASESESPHGAGRR